MEANGCDTNHLESDVLLPPRKRLLAGLKRQSSESTTNTSAQGILDSSLLCGFDSRINDLMRSCKNGCSMTLEEIAEAAGSAAAAAVEAASAARAAAEEKSAIAAKAVAAARSALDLVSSFSQESGVKERKRKRNQMKKHVPLQHLYKKNQHSKDRGTDEELARRLHQVMNSSPRILKHSPGSDSKIQKYKKLKLSPTSDNDRYLNVVSMKEGKYPFACSKDDVARTADSEGPYEEVCVVKLDDKASKSSTSDLIQENSGEAESSHTKEKQVEVSDGTYTNDRKRGRIKQKKLPLSLCSFKDQESIGTSLPAVATPDKSAGNTLPLPPLEPKDEGILSVEAAPTWKCQDFKVPECIKQNKVVHS